VSTGRQIRVFGQGYEGSRCVVFSSDGRHAYIAHRNDIRIWDVQTGTEIKQIKSTSTGGVGAALFPNNWLAAIVHRKNISIWNLASGKRFKNFDLSYMSGLVFLPDGNKALSYSDDKRVRLMDLSTGQDGLIRVAVFTTDGRTLLTGCDAGTLQLWDATSGNMRGRFSKHDYWIYDAAFLPGETRILSASRDGTVKLWDVASKKEIRTFTGHSGGISSAHISSRGTFFISGGDDGTARLWDITTGQEICRFIEFKDGEWVTMTPDGYYRASPQGDKHLNVRTGAMEVSGMVNFRRQYHNPALVESRLPSEAKEAAPKHVRTSSKANNYWILIVVIAEVTAAVIIGLIIRIKSKRVPRKEKEALKESPPAKTAPAQPEPGQTDLETAPPCESAVFVVHSADVQSLQQQGGAFSTAISGKTINLQDRLLFRGIMIAVTNMEPGGPAVVTAETTINIKKTDDQIILNCPQCGTIQEKTGRQCSSCGADLPVKIL
jgi:hypothetical protein